MKILMHSAVKFSKSEAIGKVMFGIGENLAMKGHSVEYLFGFDATPPYRDYFSGVKKIGLGIWRHLPFSFLSFAWFVRNKNFDVVHSHTPEAAFDAIVARKLLGKKFKIVVTLHGLDELILNEWKKEVQKKHEPYSRTTHFYLWLSAWKAKHSIQKADGWTAVSHSLAKDAEQLYGIRPNVVLNAVSTSVFFPLSNRMQLRKKLGWKENEKWVLFVGNVAWLKGLYYLLEAFSTLSSEYKLAIVGLYTPPVFSKEGLEKRALVEKQVGEKKLNELYNAADVVCVPSLYESFGLVHAEARMVGVPSIGCKKTGAEETIVANKTGFLVQKRSVEELEKAIERACNPIENARLRKSQKELPFESSWKTNSQAFENIFLLLVKKG